jgi:hypothetical protein
MTYILEVEDVLRLNGIADFFPPLKTEVFYVL